MRKKKNIVRRFIDSFGIAPVLLLAFSAVSIYLFDQSRTAPAEQVMALWRQSESDPIGKNILVEALRENPVPTKYELRQIENRIKRRQ